MTATHLSAGWDVQQDVGSLGIAISQTQPLGLVRQVASTRKPARCPECRAIIYSRRHKICSVCNQPLPEHLVFGPTEAERIEQLLRAERLRHRKWMAERSV